MQIALRVLSCLSLCLPAYVCCFVYIGAHDPFCAVHTDRHRRSVQITINMRANARERRVVLVRKMLRLRMSHAARRRRRRRPGQVPDRYGCARCAQRVQCGAHVLRSLIPTCAEHATRGAASVQTVKGVLAVQIFTGSVSARIGWQTKPGIVGYSVVNQVSLTDNIDNFP